jgi:hypothetical protein
MTEVEKSDTDTNTRWSFHADIFSVKWFFYECDKDLHDIGERLKDGNAVNMKKQFFEELVDDLHNL